MPQQSLSEVLRELAKVHTRDLTGTQHLAVVAGEHQGKVLERVLDQDWTGLSTQGTRQVELARRYWDGILKRRRQVGESMKLARATDCQVAEGRADARGALLPSTGVPGSVEMLMEVSRDLDERARLLALLALLGIECRWVARFNRLAQGRGPRTPVADQLAHWEDVLQAQKDAIEQTDREIYRLLQMGDWEDLVAHTDAVIRESLSARLAGWDLIDAAAALQQLRDRPLTVPAERARAAAAAVDCGRLIRRQLLSYAIAFRLAYVAAIGEETSRGRAERNRAREDAFESSSPQGTPVALADLVANPTRYDSKMVAVEGEVEDMVTAGERGRATSSFRLADPEGGSAISVFVPCVRIDSTGLVDGCAARLVGTWLKYDGESRQDNTLRINRIAFTEQAKRSWLDHQTAKVRSFFDYLPHNLNMAWSWQAGLPGAANQVYDSARRTPRNAEELVAEAN